MCDWAVRRKRHLSLVSASMLLNHNTKLYRELVDRHFTDCHNVLMDMVAPKTGKRKLQTAVDVETSNDLSSEGTSSHSKESTEESDSISVGFDDGYLKSKKSFVQSEENSTESEENTMNSKENSMLNEDSSFKSTESFENFKGELPQSDEIYKKTKESHVRCKESFAQSGRSIEQYEDISFRRKPSDENFVANREHSKESRTRSAERSFQIKENYATLEENFKETKVTSKGNEEGSDTREKSSAQSERSTTKNEEIVARSTRTSASRQESLEYIRNADSTRTCSLSRKRRSETLNRNGKRSRSAISHVSAETKENEEEQLERSPSVIIKRDVAIQTNNSYLQKRYQERFDESKPFGFTVIYDNYLDRLPSKIIFSSLSTEVKNL